jgi:hypothetical protein
MRVRWRRGLWAVLLACGIGWGASHELRGTIVEKKPRGILVRVEGEEEPRFFWMPVERSGEGRWEPRRALAERLLKLEENQEVILEVWRDPKGKFWIERLTVSEGEDDRPTDDGEKDKTQTKKETKEETKEEEEAEAEAVKKERDRALRLLEKPYRRGRDGVMKELALTNRGQGQLVDSQLKLDKLWQAGCEAYREEGSEGAKRFLRKGATQEEIKRISYGQKETVKAINELLEDLLLGIEEE